MAFFCKETGVRIAEAGVHESVQPDGHPAVIELPDGSLKKISARDAVGVKPATTNEAPPVAATPVEAPPAAPESEPATTNEAPAEKPKRAGK